MSGELGELASKWELGWEDVARDVGLGDAALKAQTLFYGEALIDEQKRFSSDFEKLEQAFDSDWSMRRRQIDDTMGKGIQSLEEILGRHGEGVPPPSYFRDLSAIIHQIIQKQIPLYQLTKPSPNIGEIQRLTTSFDSIFSEWNRSSSSVDEKHKTPAGGKRGLISRVKSRVKGWLGLKKGLKGGAPPPSAKAILSHVPKHLADAYQRSLELRMIEIASQMVPALRLLFADIMADARSRWERQKRARKAELESKTAISRLEKAGRGARSAQERREVALHRARTIANEQKDALVQAVEQARVQLGAQGQLIEQTRAQQRNTLAANNNKIVRKTRGRVYPAMDVSFGKELKTLYPELKMAPTSILQGSACNTDPTILPPVKPYQEIFRRLLTVESPYLGFLAYHGVGSGKTRLGWETIDQWFTDQIEINDAPGAPVFVLLPTNKLITSWKNEARRYLNMDRWTVREVSSSENTTVLELIHKKLNRLGNRAYVILHKISVLPDASAIRIIRKNVPADQDLIDGDGYYLPYFDYDTHPAYKDLTGEEKRLLNQMLEEQKDEIASRTKLQIPSKTLVILDEAHNDVNPSEIAKSVTMSRTTLAWANLLKKATQVKRLELSATPLLDDSKLTDLFKLLNLIQIDPTKQFFEGTWRSSLPTDESDKLKEAVAKADELESRFLLNQLLQPNGQWIPGQKEKLQSSYAGLISYLTLSNDPTVYPSLSTDCTSDPKSTCTMLWRANELKELSVDELEEMGLQKPRSGKNVLVPMNQRQFKEMNKAIQSDLSTWREHRRFDTDSSRPTAEGLNYAGPARTFKASIMQSWGMRSYREHGKTQWADKAQATLFLMKKKYPGDKFFIYTSSLAQWFASQFTDFLEEVGGYEVWDISKFAKFIGSHPAESQGDNADEQLAKAWLARNRTPSSKRGILMFIGSSTALKDLHQRTKSLVRDLMLALYNHPANLSGELFQAFVGDRSTKEGLSLLHTMHVVFLEPAANATMQTQAEARILRFCSLQKFPFDRWRQVQLWRMISIPPKTIVKSKVAPRRRLAPRRRAGTTLPTHLYLMTRHRLVPTPQTKLWRMGGALSSDEKGMRRTNEEWHYRYLMGRQSPSETILNALKEVAIDCQLFRDYNGDPAVRLCYGQSPSEQMRPINSSSSARFDRYCSKLNYILLQDEDEAILTEFSLKGTNPEGIRDGDSFDRRCNLALAPIISLAPVSYRDELILEALQEEPQADLVGSAFAVKEILGMLSKEKAGTDSFTLQDDLRLWSLVTSLSDYSGHRSALERLVRHRLSRGGQQLQSKFAGMVDQITTWIRLKMNLDAAIATLTQFYRAIPSFQSFTSFISNTPSTTPIPPRRLLPPSAPDLH